MSYVIVYGKERVHQQITQISHFKERQTNKIDYSLELWSESVFQFTTPVTTKILNIAFFNS